MISKLSYIIKLYNFKRKWRKINPHNQTVVSRMFKLDNVRVANNSYGKLNVYQWGTLGEYLEIGSYVSIANDVKFILGGNHRYDTISTYPFKVKLLGEVREAYTNGKIVVEDDVWIGMNSTIMSGVRIGKGAVIAAGSNVTKDIEAFSIVGGNPAKHIKYRFNKEIRDLLIDFNLNDIPEEYIKEKNDLLYLPVTGDIVKKIIGDINGFEK